MPTRIHSAWPERVLIICHKMLGICGFLQPPSPPKSRKGERGNVSCDEDTRQGHDIRGDNGLTLSGWSQGAFPKEVCVPRSVAHPEKGGWPRAVNAFPTTSLDGAASLWEHEIIRLICAATSHFTAGGRRGGGTLKETRGAELVRVIYRHGAGSLKQIVAHTEIYVCYCCRWLNLASVAEGLNHMGSERISNSNFKNFDGNDFQDYLCVLWGGYLKHVFNKNAS